MTEMEGTPTQLRMSIEVSLRYHNRRRSFFDFLHKIVATVGIVGGSSAFAALASDFKQTWPAAQNVAIWGAFSVAALNVFDLVIGFGPMARQHHSLFQKNVILAAKMDRTTSPTMEQFQEWRSEKLMIDHDEPPPFHALYFMCKNEVMASWGSDEAKSHIVKIPFWRRVFAQILKQPQFVR